MRTRALALAATLALSGCGFQPMYAPATAGAAAAGALGPMAVAPIDGRVGYFLREALVRQLPAGASEQTLEAVVTTRFVPLAVRIDGSAARTDLIGELRYRVKTAGGGAVVSSGTVSATVSYDLLDQPFGDVAAQNDAEERLAALLAERVRTDLALRAAHAEAR